MRSSWTSSQVLKHLLLTSPQSPHPSPGVQPARSEPRPPVAWFGEAAGDVGGKILSLPAIDAMAQQRPLTFPEDGMIFSVPSSAGRRLKVAALLVPSFSSMSNSSTMSIKGLVESNSTP